MSMSEQSVSSTSSAFLQQVSTQHQLLPTNTCPVAAIVGSMADTGLLIKAHCEWHSGGAWGRVHKCHLSTKARLRHSSEHSPLTPT